MFIGTNFRCYNAYSEQKASTPVSSYSTPLLETTVLLISLCIPPEYPAVLRNTGSESQHTITQHQLYVVFAVTWTEPWDVRTPGKHHYTTSPGLSFDICIAQVIAKLFPHLLI